MAPPIIKQYTIFFKKYKLFGLLVFLALSGASVLFALIQPPPGKPKYSAEGILSGNQLQVSLSQTGTEIQQSGQRVDEETLLTQPVIESVAARLQIKPGRLAKSVKLKIDAQTSDTGAFQSLRAVNVTYEANDEALAEEAVNLLMQAMVEQSRLVNAARLRSIIDAVNERLPEVTDDLRGAEQALERFDREEGAAILAARNGTLVGAITGSQQQQRQLRLTLSGLDAQISSLESRLGLSADQAYYQSALSSDPIIANLRTQIYQTETQIAILSRDLRPEHPNLIELQNQRRAFEGLLQQRASEVISGDGIAAPFPTGVQVRQDSNLDPSRQQLANNLVALQAQQDTLRQQLNTAIQEEANLRQEYATIPNKELERARLAQTIALKKALFDQLQARLVDTQAAEAETVSSLRLAQPAIVTEVPPAEPLSGFLIVVAGGAGGLVAGAAVIFLLGILEGVLYVEKGIRAILEEQDLPIVGRIPYLDISPEGFSATGIGKLDVLPLLIDSDAPYADFYERFRSSLRQSANNQPTKVILVTSTVPQEGKSVTAYNLAIAFARAGKRTVVIEADLRGSSEAGSVRITPDVESYLEPLLYYGQTNSCVRFAPDVENLFVVPSPGPQQRPAAILESSEMQRLLDDVRNRFDQVIIDAPALDTCNDALLLQPYTDGIVYVTCVGVSPGSLLTETLEQLVEAELPIIGVVINKVDESVSPDKDAEVIEIDSYGVGTSGYQKHYSDIEELEELDDVDYEASELESVSSSSR